MDHLPPLEGWLKFISDLLFHALYFNAEEPHTKVRASVFK